MSSTRRTNWVRLLWKIPEIAFDLLGAALEILAFWSAAILRLLVRNLFPGRLSAWVDRRSERKLTELYSPPPHLRQPPLPPEFAPLTIWRSWEEFHAARLGLTPVAASVGPDEVDGLPSRCANCMITNGHWSPSPDDGDGLFWMECATCRTVRVQVAEVLARRSRQVIDERLAAARSANPS